MSIYGNNCLITSILLPRLSQERVTRKCSKVCDLATVLDAFTCAKTANFQGASFASRVYELQYDAAGKAVGAVTSLFNLDKNRLVVQPPGEHSFAVFYQMIAGASEAEKRTLHLQGAQKFRFLSLNENSKYSDYCDEQDAQRYRQLKNAMNSVGLGNIERAAILRMLSAILWLGEIKFVVKPDAARAVIWDAAVTDVVANLLRCSSEDLDRALTQPDESRSRPDSPEIEGLHAVESSPRGGGGGKAPVVDRAHTLHDDAIYSRDAFAKVIYTRVVNWLLEKANGELSADHAFTSIAVLDIAGANPDGGGGGSLNGGHNLGSFCRGYVNECVQELFNRIHFESQEREYANEGIVLPSFEYPSNRGCVDMIERQGGLLALLDQVSQMTFSNDAVLLNHMNTQLSRDNHYTRGRMKKQFQVEHCGGPVSYSVEGFTATNRDLLPGAILHLMDRCKCRFLAEIFPLTSLANPPGKMSRPVTLGASLKHTLAAVFRNLSQTTIHFVRCVAPRRSEESRQGRQGVPATGGLDQDYVRQQLSSAKVIEVLRLRHAGYPARSYFDDFYRRYKMFAPGMSDFEGVSHRKQCELILTGLELPRDSWQVGRSKVYFREKHLEFLEARRASRREDAIITMQAFARRGYCKKRYHRTKSSTEPLLAVLKALLQRQIYVQMYENAELVKLDKEASVLETEKYKEGSNEDRELALMQKEEDELADVQAQWRSELGKDAFENAQSVFDEAMLQFDAMESLWNRGFDAHPDEEILVITSTQVVDVIEHYVGREKDLQHDELEFEQEEAALEAEVCTRMAQEERYLHSVKNSISRRREPHPLEELAAMRAEDAMMQVIERIARLESLMAEPGEDAPVVSGGDMLDLINMLVDPEHATGQGMALEELERIEEGNIVEFTEVVEEEEEEEDHIDYAAPDSEEEERERQEAERLEQEEKTSTKAGTSVTGGGGGGGGGGESSVSDATGSTSTAADSAQGKSKDADRAEIQRMIEDRRRARQPTRPIFDPEDDDLFTGIDDELNALKETFFAAGKDGELEFDGAARGAQEQDGAAMHKFKFMSPSLKNVRSTE